MIDYGDSIVKPPLTEREKAIIKLTDNLLRQAQETLDELAKNNFTDEPTALANSGVKDSEKCDHLYGLIKVPNDCSNGPWHFAPNMYYVDFRFYYCPKCGERLK